MRPVLTASSLGMSSVPLNILCRCLRVESIIMLVCSFLYMCAMLYINYVSVCMKCAFVKVLAGCTFQQHYLEQS